jgi:hypothetical protein
VWRASIPTQLAWTLNPNVSRAYFLVIFAHRGPPRSMNGNAPLANTPTGPKWLNARFVILVSTKIKRVVKNANGALWGNFCPTKEVLPCFTMTQTIVKSVVRIRTPMKPAYGFAKVVWQTTSFKTVAPMKPCTTTGINAF